jgi:cytochrome c553
MTAVSTTTGNRFVRLMAAMVASACASHAFAGWTPLPPWQGIEDVANARCNVCHSAGGVGANPLFPKLAGQNADYLFRQMQNFRNGIRKGPVMYYQLSDLATEDVMALAKHYAGLSRPSAMSGQSRLEAVGEKIFGRGVLDRGTAACAHCHGIDGRGGGVMPRLAAQHAGYVSEQLRRFQQGTRVAGQTPEHPVADALSEEEILAVSTYIATLP